MVVVLSKDPSIQNYWQRLWRRISVKEEKILGESVMFVHPGEEPDWDKLAKKLGNYTERIVVGKGIELPDTEQWKPMDVCAVEEKILGDTICDLAGRDENIGIYDPEGRLQALVEELAEAFSKITVFCPLEEAYENLCKNIFEQQGTSIELTSAWDGLMDCSIIGGLTPPNFRLRWRGIFLLPGETEIPPISGWTGSLFKELRLPVPNELKKLCPLDVPPKSLYLALLKEGRVKAPEGLRYLLPEDAYSENFECDPF